MCVWVQVPSSAAVHAEVAELADAHGSGPCDGNIMRVQVPSSALHESFESGRSRSSCFVYCSVKNPGYMLQYNIIVRKRVMDRP